MPLRRKASFSHCSNGAILAIDRRSANIFMAVMARREQGNWMCSWRDSHKICLTTLPPQSPVSCRCVSIHCKPNSFLFLTQETPSRLSQQETPKARRAHSPGLATPPGLWTRRAFGAHSEPENNFANRGVSRKAGLDTPVLTCKLI